jgi:hypothetical protein
MRSGWFVVELRGRGTCVCWLCCSLLLIIVTNNKDACTLIICLQYIYPCFRTTISPIFEGQVVWEMSVSINLFCIRCQKSEDSIYNAAESWNHESLLLLSFSSPGIYIATRNCKGLFFQGCREGLILKKAYFLENYTSTDVWQCHIRGRCSYVRRTKQGRKICAL